VITAGVYPILVDGRDAVIEIGVFDGNGEFVGGATVEGLWTHLDRRGREKTTLDSAVSSDAPSGGSFGNAVISQRFPPNSQVVSFCVTSVSAPGYEYVTPPITCGYPLTGQAVTIRRS
jgi:hypothetical protein